MIGMKLLVKLRRVAVLIVQSETVVLWDHVQIEE